MLGLSGVVLRQAVCRLRDRFRPALHEPTKGLSTRNCGACGPCWRQVDNGWEARAQTRRPLRMVRCQVKAIGDLGEELVDGTTEAIRSKLPGDEK